MIAWIMRFGTDRRGNDSMTQFTDELAMARERAQRLSTLTSSALASLAEDAEHGAQKTKKKTRRVG